MTTQLYYLFDRPDHPADQPAVARAARPTWLTGPLALVVSDFDGVHREQRRLVARGAGLAAQMGARPVALTFWPPPGLPDDFTGPLAGAGRLLTTLDERLELLAGLRMADGAPALAGIVVVANTAELAQRLRTPTEALARLGAWFDLRALLGLADEAEAAAALDLAALRPLASRQGITIETLVPTPTDLDVDGEERGELGAPASAMASFSQSIRSLIAAGQMHEATQCLAGAYRLQGVVGAGDQRGRLLGYPTANLQPDPRKALPANGIYAVRVRLPGERSYTHAGAANVGVRPTFTTEGAAPRRLVEVYLLDATLDLYGLTIGVEFVQRLRPEQRFSGPHALDELKQQMARDIQQTRLILAQS